MVRCKSATGSSRMLSPPEPVEITIFENDAAEECYLQIQSKQLLQEKGFMFSNEERFGLPKNSDLKGPESIKAESRLRYSEPRPKDREGRIKVNIKDLKPKRIKRLLGVQDQPKERSAEIRISRENLPDQTRCLLSRHPLCHPAQADYRSP
ncbi:hypothetical protein GQ457_14G013750 [Hibiscus cannabinus]